MLAAWCGPDGPGLVAGLLLAGLAGGPVHCAAMCGPFVLGQAADGMARIPAARLCGFSRLQAGMLAPYHAGRLLTYAGLGALAGALGALPGVSRVAPFMLLLGAVLFLVLAARRVRLLARLVPALPGGAAPARLVWLLGAVTGRIDRGRISGGLLLGLALGFLPCGLLYAALAVAAGSGAAWRGAACMAAFGLGTVPALVAVGVAGRALRGRAAGLAPGLMLLNAGLLAVAGWQAFAG